MTRDLYDHLIRMFLPDQGDLRVGTMGVFGSLQSRSQLFVRVGAHKSVCNSDDRSTDRERTLTGFRVWLHFAETTEDVCDPVLLERKCMGMRLTVLVEGDEREHPVHAQFIAPGNVFIGPPSVDVVRVPAGKAWQMICHVNDDVREHLNGMVLRNEHWEPGDPKMVRIVRVGCTETEIA